MNFFIRLFFIVVFYFWSFIFADVENGDELYPISFPYSCASDCKLDITYDDLELDDEPTISDLTLEYRGTYSEPIITFARSNANMELSTGLRIVNNNVDAEVASMHYILMPKAQDSSSSTLVENTRLTFNADFEMNFDSTPSDGGEQNPVPFTEYFIQIESNVSRIVIKNSASVTNRTYLREDEESGAYEQQGALFHITGDKSMIAIGEDASISSAGTALYFDKDSIYASDTSSFGMGTFAQYLSDFESDDLVYSSQFKPSYVCEDDEEDCGSFYETYGIDEPTEIEFNFIALVESFFGQITSYGNAIHLEYGNGYFAVNDFADIDVRNSGKGIYVSGESSALIYVGSYSSVQTVGNGEALYFDNDGASPNEIILYLNGATIEAGYDEDNEEGVAAGNEISDKSYGIYTQADVLYLYADASSGTSNSIEAYQSAIYVGEQTEIFNFFINSDLDLTVHDPDGSGGSSNIIPEPTVFVNGVDTVNLITIYGDISIYAPADIGVAMYFKDNGNVDVKFENGEKSEDDTTLFDVTLTVRGSLIFENNSSLNLDLGQAIINGNDTGVAIKLDGNGSSILKLADDSDIEGDIYLDTGTEATFGKISIQGSVYMGDDSTLTMDGDTSIVQGKFDGTDATGEIVNFSCSKYDEEGEVDQSKTCTIEDDNYINIDYADFKSGTFEFKGEGFNKETFVSILVRSKVKIYFRDNITVQDIFNEGSIYIEKNLTMDNYIAEDNSYTYVTVYGDSNAHVDVLGTMTVNGNHKFIIQNDIYEYKDIIKSGSFQVLSVTNLDGEINFDDNMAVLEIIQTNEAGGVYTVSAKRIEYSDLINSLSVDTSSIKYINTIKIAGYLDEVIRTDRYSNYVVLINNLDANSPTANSIYEHIDELNPLYNNENIKALENTQKNISSLIMSNMFLNRFRTYDDRMWGSLIMNFNGGDSTFGYSSIGGFVAKDYFRTKNTRIGFGGNFVRNKIFSRSHTLNTETLQSFVYGTYRPSKFFVDTVLFLGYNFNGGQKSLSFMKGAFDELDVSRVKYHFHSLQADFNIETGYIVGNLKTITLEPFVFLDSFYNQGYSYNEKSITDYQGSYADQSNFLLHVNNSDYSSNYLGLGTRLNINMNLFSNELVYTGSYSLIVEYKFARNLKYGRFNNFSSYYVIGQENTISGSLEHTKMGEYYNTFNISYKVSEKYKHFLITYTFDKSGNFINNTFGFKYYMKLKNKTKN